MGCLSKIFFGLVSLVLILFVAAGVMWVAIQWGLPTLVDRQLRATTGFGLKVNDFQYDFRRTAFSARGLRVENPTNWPAQGSFATVGELLIDVVPGSFRSDEWIFEEVLIHLEELHVSFNIDGASNLAELQRRLNALNLPPPTERAYRIQKLRLRADTLKQTALDPEGNSYERITPLNLDLELENVTDLNAVRGAVLRTLFRSGFPRQ